MGGGASLGVPATISGLHSWYRADTGITTVGGAVSTWAPRSGSYDLTQGTGTAQPTHITSNAAFNSQSSVSGDGGDRVQHGTASVWNFLHDGSGCTLVLVAKQDAADTASTIVATNIAITSIGAQIRSDTSGNVSYTVGNGTVSIIAQTIQTNVDAALFKTTCRYEEGRAGNEYATRYNGGADSTGNSSAAPSASDATGGLTVFSRTSGAIPLTGDVAEVIIYSRYITDAEANAIDAYLLARYGV